MKKMHVFILLILFFLILFSVYAYADSNSGSGKVEEKKIGKIVDRLWDANKVDALVKKLIEKGISILNKKVLAIQLKSLFFFGKSDDIKVVKKITEIVLKNALSSPRLTERLTSLKKEAILDFLNQNNLNPSHISFKWPADFYSEVTTSIVDERFIHIFFQKKSKLSTYAFLHIPLADIIISVEETLLEPEIFEKLKLLLQREVITNIITTLDEVSK